MKGYKKSFEIHPDDFKIVKQTLRVSCRRCGYIWEEEQELLNRIAKHYGDTNHTVLPTYDACDMCIKDEERNNFETN